MEMCLFYADFKHFLANNLQYFQTPQGLVNHASQPLIKHEIQSNWHNVRLTSLLKRIPSRA
jgi:hypothetical protein